MSGGTVAQPLSSFSDILQKSRRLNAANMFWPQNVTVYTNIYIYMPWQMTRKLGHTAACPTYLQATSKLRSIQDFRLHILKQLAVLPMPHVGPQPAHATERQGDGQQETGAESHQGEPAADV